MMYKRTYNCFRQTVFLKGASLLLAIMLLVGCSATPSPAISDNPASSFSPSMEVQETAASTPSPKPTPVFEGVVGQDWYEIRFLCLKKSEAPEM